MIRFRLKTFAQWSPSQSDLWNSGDTKSRAAVLALGPWAGSYHTAKLQEKLGVSKVPGLSAIRHGDISAEKHNDLKKVYNYLSKNGRLEDFRGNYGKKGYRIKDIKSEMKGKNIWY